MKEKRAITKFIVTTILVLLGLVLTVFHFNIPGTYYKYNGFARAISTGLDFNGGYLAVYDVKSDAEGTDLDKKINSTIEKIRDYLDEQEHKEALILKQENDGGVQIRIESTKNDVDIKNLLDLLGEPKLLEIKKEKSDTAEVFLTSEHIKKVTADRQLGTDGYIYGVSLEFNKEGTKLFKDITTELAESSGSLHLYLGGEYYSSAQVSNAIEDGKTFISGGMNSLTSAQDYATRILSGSLDVELIKESVEEVTSIYGVRAKFLTFLACAFAVAIICLLLYVFYKDLGLVTILNVATFGVLLMFFMQAIPLISLTKEGVVAMIFAFAFSVICNIICMEKMREEYKLGKKVATSIKSGVKKSLFLILDISVVLLLANIMLCICGNVILRNFSIICGVGILLNLFTSLFLSKVYFNWYTKINSKKAEKINFKREATIDEIE